MSPCFFNRAKSWTSLSACKASPAPEALSLQGAWRQRLARACLEDLRSLENQRLRAATIVQVRLSRVSELLNFQYNGFSVGHCFACKAQLLLKLFLQGSWRQKLARMRINDLRELDRLVRLDHDQSTLAATIVQVRYSTGYAQSADCPITRSPRFCLAISCS